MDNSENSVGEYEELRGVHDVSPDDITRDTIWRTQTGARIAIKNMSDKHLLNTIRVLRDMSPRGTRFVTTCERRQRWVNAMANEVYTRGLQLDPLTEGEPVHE